MNTLYRWLLFAPERSGISTLLCYRYIYINIYIHTLEGKNYNDTYRYKRILLAANVIGYPEWLYFLCAFPFLFSFFKTKYFVKIPTAFTLLWTPYVIYYVTVLCIVGNCTQGIQVGSILSCSNSNEQNIWAFSCMHTTSSVI